MIKVFLKLSFFVFLPLLFLIMPHQYSPVSLVNDSIMKKRLVSTYQGAFYLMEQRLNELPESQWLEEFPSIVSGFRYDMRLLPIDQVESYTAKRQFKKSDYAFVGNETPNAVLKRIADGNWAISISLEDSPEQEIINAGNGVLTLIKQDLESLDQNLWTGRLEELQQQFGFPLKLLDAVDPFLPKEKIKKFYSNGVTWTSDEDDNTSMYYQLPDNDKVLLAGPAPFPGSALSVYLAVIIVIVGAISTGILLFVFPLWWDLKKLAKSAAIFGDGHLDCRAAVGRHSDISKLATSFNAMADRIEMMIKGQRDLTNAIAHDLRTPLSRLSFAFEMLNIQDVSDKDKKRYAQSIATSIDTLDYLIQQILALSRYSRAVDITQFGEYKLTTILMEEIEQQRLIEPQLNIEFNVDPDLVDQIFFVDQRAMIRALGNLLSNAIRYAASAINIRLSANDGSYQLSVEDDGPGISIEMRERVFLPFSQIGNQQRKISDEHGLGLAIVQQIAMWHKGSVTLLDSKLGGARFDIIWPIPDSY